MAFVTVHSESAILAEATRRAVAAYEAREGVKPARVVFLGLRATTDPRRPIRWGDTIALIPSLKPVPICRACGRAGELAMDVRTAS